MFRAYFCTKPPKQRYICTKRCKIDNTEDVFVLAEQNKESFLRLLATWRPPALVARLRYEWPMFRLGLHSVRTRSDAVRTAFGQRSDTAFGRAFGHGLVAP